MEIQKIDGETRSIGASQGYIPLSMRDIKINCAVNGQDTPAMESAWKPSTEELAKLVAGEPLILRILGTSHPPVMIYVGEPR